MTQTQNPVMQKETETRAWLLQHVCPFWFERVMDPAGGFYEGLDAASKPVLSPERTILNQARLTYVASHAFLLGGGAPMRAAAEHGLAFLELACKEKGSSAGWPKRLSVDGTALDGTRDAYDHAFIIFAMAWHYRATANPKALALANDALGFMKRFLADGAKGGYFEEYPDTGKLPRRQNPHMHLLEAVLAMYESTRDAGWLNEAGLLVRLFLDKLTDPQTGAVVEYFKKDWTVADGAAGSLREPGHQFEWVWLLGQYMQLADDKTLTKQVERLFSFGRDFGIDHPDKLGGAVFDGVDAGGKLVADTKLFWPQTEYIKACCYMAHSTGDRKWAEAARAHTRLLRTHYFKADGANWCNQLSRNGDAVVDVTPSRVLYHLFLAMAELLCLEDQA
ncbi:MAG TPA: AGE family epimerase/isomerase [Polaromonas sp.]|uniref:AGE family epimerase/isomerase n=1 Tax=Polaromonas sp. TaxID=1869339 RepID=UPI002D6FB328|nr:AGE family epimerase/isomerase [Polaromonas sp.]HYW55629.1 AGE family epimerase/isomerase [Polaromonas sp.]